MNNSNKQKSCSDYWLGNLFDKYFESKVDPKSSSFAQAYSLIRLAAVRRAVSNFVCITTNKNIDVFFNDDDSKNSFTDAEKGVTISSKIDNKRDLDVTVGLALHEAVHIVKSDPKLIKLLMGRMPDRLKSPALAKGVRLSQIETFVRRIWGWIEDRFIDDWEWRNAPGYRGYYTALYNKYFFDPRITDILKSDALRVPTLRAYKYRIYNLMNSGVDLNALPALCDIAKMIDLTNINRLETPDDRMNLSFDVCIKVFENISTDPKKNNQPGNSSVNDSDQCSDEDDESSEKPNLNNGDDSIPNDPPGDKNLDPVLENIENEKLVNGWGDTKGFSDKELEKIEQSFLNQEDFIRGDIKKSEIDKSQKNLLELIEKMGIEMVPVGGTMIGNINKSPVDCIVVRRMSRELVFSPLFPLLYAHQNEMTSEIKPHKEIEEAVFRGIRLGKSLGKKLRVRNEITITKFPRRSTGKIDKRVLAGIACGMEDIFYQLQVGEYNNVTIHLSVDASSSMSLSNKWSETMTMVVAICKATSMISNIRTVVSFRSTVDPGIGRGFALPYVVVAYDSEVDKFTKIKSLFPFLGPNGWTPEGLAFEAISELFNKKMGEDFYFVNISDGEPCMEISYKAFNTVIDIKYMDDVAVNHTRREVQKIRYKGVKVISYFISSGYIMSSDISAKKQFKRMYGEDSQFIDVTNVVDISKTMNEKFIQIN